MTTTRITLTPEMAQVAEFFADMKKTSTLIAGTTSPVEVPVTDWAHVYFVGGCVRDLLFGNDPTDYDLATDATPDDIVAHAKAKGRKANLVGAQFGTVKVKVPIGHRFRIVDVTTYRGDTYNGDGRKPVVTFGRDIVADLSRRDFTVNAIAARPTGVLVDPYDGAGDIERRILRAVTSASGGPRVRFHEDPLRILRGIRLAAKYALGIEEKTAVHMEHMRWELLRLSKERITEEIDKMLNLDDIAAVERALLMLFNFRAWQMICPPLQRQARFDQQSPHHEWTLDRHSIRVALGAIEAEHQKSYDALCADTLFEAVARAGWAGLLHDIAKPDTRELHKSGTRYNYIGHEVLGAEIVEAWERRYRWSNERRQFVVDTVRHHLEDDNWLRPFDQAAKKTADPTYYLPGGSPAERNATP